MEDVTPGLRGMEVRKDKNNSLFFEEPNGTSSKLTQKHRPLALKHTRVYSLFYYEVYEFNFIRFFSTHTFFLWKTSCASNRYSQLKLFSSHLRKKMESSQASYPQKHMLMWLPHHLISRLLGRL